MQTWFTSNLITTNLKGVKSKPRFLCKWFSPEANGSLVEKGTDWNLNEKNNSLSLLMKINRSFNYINLMKDQALICCCILNFFREAHLFWKKCNSLYEQMLYFFEILEAKWLSFRSAFGIILLSNFVYAENFPEAQV